MNNEINLNDLKSTSLRILTANAQTTGSIEQKLLRSGLKYSAGESLFKMGIGLNSVLGFSISLGEITPYLKGDENSFNERKCTIIDARYLFKGKS
ncbi:hypothetical protein L1267_20470 [Pseudoalteromonas sp. OFAV1]|jgi:hypothetical protein|uniref:hypothetical protein n=1 Tax=Pseudoalteromonas sp. OFAV1 TaxID=2908892 RepID=UPI001F27655E|nr:hypothetical protein [Pseudoalteromonas sp. OFAV1]MCF2902748.1 hypothetical protein [Pseudoalteromonas sp. OFAV1]